MKAIIILMILSLIPGIIVIGVGSKDGGAFLLFISCLAIIYALTMTTNTYNNIQEIQISCEK